MTRMRQQTTWMIGRSSQCDIPISNDDTVSRFHAELVIGQDNKPFLADRESKQGTWIWMDGRWQRQLHGYVQLGTRVRLGSYETTIDDLMNLIPKA